VDILCGHQRNPGHFFHYTHGECEVWVEAYSGIKAIYFVRKTLFSRWDIYFDFKHKVPRIRCNFPPGVDIIKVNSHVHVLVKVLACGSVSGFVCNICRQENNGSLGYRWHCTFCQYDLCEYCALKPENLQELSGLNTASSCTKTLIFDKKWSIGTEVNQKEFTARLYGQIPPTVKSYPKPLRDLKGYRPPWCIEVILINCGCIFHSEFSSS